MLALDSLDSWEPKKSGKLFGYRASKTLRKCKNDFAASNTFDFAAIDRDYEDT